MMHAINLHVNRFCRLSNELEIVALLRAAVNFRSYPTVTKTEKYFEKPLHFY